METQLPGLEGTWFSCWRGEERAALVGIESPTISTSSKSNPAGFHFLFIYSCFYLFFWKDAVDCFLLGQNFKGKTPLMVSPLLLLLLRLLVLLL